MNAITPERATLNGASPNESNKQQPYTRKMSAEGIAIDREEELSRGAVLRRVVGLDAGYLKYLDAALDVIENLSHDEAPAEGFVWSVLGDYTMRRLSPAAALADVEDYKANIKELQEESATDPNGPEQLGCTIREELRRAALLRARDSFRSWSYSASARDLLIAYELLVNAESNQSRSDFDASLLSAITQALGRQDIVYCPREYTYAALSYVERLVAGKEA